MRILVNDIAAAQGGGLSILEDFYQYLIDSNDQNEWHFLLGKGYIQETPNIKVHLFERVKNSRFSRLWFDFFSGQNVVADIHPDVIFYLQNTVIERAQCPQVMYMDQPLAFTDIRRFSFVKKDEFPLAVYQHLIGILNKHACHESERVIVQTEAMKKAVCKKADIPTDKVVVIAPSLSDISCFRKDNVFQPASFFYPTADILYKNNDCIYDACALLNNKGYCDFKVQLTITSDKEHDNIRFLGRIPRAQVFEQYNTSTLLFPSYVETFGLPMAEARQLGTLILASDCPFSREILDGYENAYFFDPFQPQELAALMERVINGEIKIKPSTAPAIQEVSSWHNVISVIHNLPKP